MTVGVTKRNRVGFRDCDSTDEAMTPGRQVLTVFLRFLDIRVPCEPKKRKCLLDVSHLQQTTGIAISATILESLKDNQPSANAADKFMVQPHQ